MRNHRAMVAAVGVCASVLLAACWADSVEAVGIHKTDDSELQLLWALCRGDHVAGISLRAIYDEDGSLNSRPVWEITFDTPADIDSVLLGAVPSGAHETASWGGLDLDDSSILYFSVDIDRVNAAGDSRHYGVGFSFRPQDVADLEQGEVQFTGGDTMDEFEDLRSQAC
jgi:hypothetical protein